MKRPQSAKAGYRGYWGQASAEDISESRGATKNRKQVHLMKPDLTTNEFSRVLPKKMMHDKERLYSQALQLKQSLNEVMEENIRLKTKISILEKEKDKINKYIQTAPQGAIASKGNSRLQIYGSKGGPQKQNLMVRNLKKMIRQAKQQNEYLKTQNTKIKKTIKYTRINQLQIEKKMLMDENKRLSVILEEYSVSAADAEGLQNENHQLKKYLQEQIQENKEIDDQKYKYKQIAEELDQKLQMEVKKNQGRQKKLQGELALQKRRVADANKYIQEIRKELRNLQNAQAEAMKKKPVSKPIRPQTSVPGGLRVGAGRAMTATQPKQSEGEIQNIKLKNKELELELRQIRLKLQQSELEVKKRENVVVQKQTERQKPKQKVEKKEVVSPVKVQPKPQFKEVKEQLKLKTQSKIQENKQQIEKSASPNKIQPKVIQVQAALSSPQKQKMKIRASEPAAQKEQQSYGQAQFDKQEEQQYNHQFQQQEKHDLQIQNLKKDFEANDEQEELYRKDQKPEKKAKSAKKQGKAKKSKTKDKDLKQSKTDYKPDKKILAQIRQLLTYRMKAQRYPFSDLQEDINAAQSQQFTYEDLCNMLVNEPFYLTSTYTKAFLSYCYQKQEVGSRQLLTSGVLIQKLRKVINQFELVDQNEQKQMILRIAEMTSSYPAQLESAFESIKNGQETVTKQDLVSMFQKLQLEDKYIDLIISELSLCSDDLQHLNFHGFFQRFYMDDGQEEDPAVNAIRQQQSQESAYNSSRAHKSKPRGKHQDDQGQPHAPFMLAPQQPIANKNYKFDDQDIVSDDGHL